MATLHADATDSAPALLLRPWEPRDLDALIEVYRDPVLRQWTQLHVTDRDDGARWLEEQWRGWAAGTRLSFAVFEPAEEPAAGLTEGGLPTSRLVANVAIKRPDPTEPTAEVGYWTAAARGRGVAPRALEALTAWAFRTLDGSGPDVGLDHLELLHQVDNTASCRVAEKSGYDFEAILPAYPPSYPLDGHLHIRRNPR
ncbi:GNAT family N-acetyltransferase [Streptomyces sp. NPDC088725]|uniref:GNAT family N-acetyltransferase n=1 Tax=Streptomyces sp. NPDC088725 TaxID=3365873 RepID=UPI00380390BE